MDFEALVERFYGQLDLKDSVVLDVGAHTGRHAIPLARRTGPAGFVYAFEPIPAVRLKLTENLTAAGINHVAVFPCALASESGVRDFIYVPNLPEESGLKKRHLYNAPPDEPITLKVNTFRVDELIPAGLPLSFIKIDVEGGELDVLRGAERTLSETRPIVAFECGAASFLGYHEDPEGIFRIFADLGYSITSITGKAIGSAEEFSREAYAQNFWDYVALPPGRQTLARYLLT